MAEETLLKRVAPNSLEAEQSVVGAMLMDKEAIEIASEIVNPDDFYNRQLGTVFETMEALLILSRFKTGSGKKMFRHRSAVPSI